MLLGGGMEKRDLRLSLIEKTRDSVEKKGCCSLTISKLMRIKKPRS